MAGRADRRYCSPRCRVAAHRARKRDARKLVQTAALDEATLVGYILSASETNWRAGAWLLERVYPERWGAGARPRPEAELPTRRAADDAFREAPA
jgi:hypothetical protein